MLYVGKHYSERAEMVFHDRIEKYGYRLSLYSGEMPTQEDINSSNVQTGTNYKSAGYANNPPAKTFYRSLNDGLQSVSKTNYSRVGADNNNIGTVFIATGPDLGDGTVTEEHLITELVNLTEYTILTAGDSDFTLIGAADNIVGTTFTATGPGTGTGTVTESIAAGALVNGTEYTIVNTDPYSAKLIGSFDLNIQEILYVDGVVKSFETMKTLNALSDGPVTFFELSNKKYGCWSYRIYNAQDGAWWYASDDSNVMSSYGTVYGLVGQAGTNNNLTINKQNIVKDEKFHVHDLYLDFTQDIAAVKAANPTLL